jgi:hypothetical protein
VVAKKAGAKKTDQSHDIPTQTVGEEKTSLDKHYSKTAPSEERYTRRCP